MDFNILFTVTNPHWRLHRLTIQKAITWILEQGLNKMCEET